MKKGQVTIFIILGIVILIVVGLLFALRAFSVSSRLYIEGGKSVSVPTQLKPVTDFISGCIESTAVDGLRQMGMQGGYVEVPKDTIPRSPINPFSNSIYINKNIEVPYWFYESVSGVVRSQVPSIEDMQKDLSSYLEENLLDCISDFDEFSSQGYEISTASTPSVSTKIKDTYVEVNVDYPVNIALKDVQRKITTHYDKIDINYGKLYKLAVSILNEENAGYFLENKTLDIMSVYDDIPTSGGSIDCTPRVWTRQQVENNLKAYLIDNTAAIRVSGTKDSSTQKYFLVDANDAYGDVNVDFVFYDNYPFEMVVNGGDEFLREDSVVGRTTATSLLLGIFCLNNYNFVYDIKYPVLVVLADLTNKHSINFEFATQVLIKNNQPRENRIYVNENVLPDVDRVCKTRSVNTTIYAINSVTGEQIRDAQVTFDCVGATCELGMTSLDSLDEISITGSLPYCYNGQVNVYHKNFANAKTRVDTNGIIPSVSVLLKPKHTLDVDVKVIDNGQIRELARTESYIISFENRADEFSSVVADSKVELVSGRYLVKAYLLKNVTEQFKIDSQEVEYCNDIPRAGVLGVLGFKEKKCSKQQIDTTSLEQIIVGGEEFSYDVQENALFSAKKITVYLVLKQEPRDITELKDIYYKIQANAQDSTFSLPVIS